MDSGKNATAVAKGEIFWIKGSVMWQTAGSRCTFINTVIPINPVEGGGGEYLKKRRIILALRALAHIEGMHRA